MLITSFLNEIITKKKLDLNEEFRFLTGKTNKHVTKLISTEELAVYS